MLLTSDFFPSAPHEGIKRQSHGLQSSAAKMEGLLVAVPRRYTRSLFQNLTGLRKLRTHWPLVCRQARINVMPLNLRNG